MNSEGMKRKSRAFTTIEFSVVVLLLIIIFVSFIDMSLFFRAPYRLQTFSDEALVKLQNVQNCSDVNVVRNAIIPLARKHFGKDFEFTDSVMSGSPDSPVLILNESPLNISIQCNNPYMAGSVLVQEDYNGIIMYKNRRLISNPVSKKDSYY